MLKSFGIWDRLQVWRLLALPFFLAEPANNGWESPVKLGITSTRIEVFSDDPDTFIDRAVQAGANGNFDNIKNHEGPWGIHIQGGFTDPFGHIWFVGDKSPLHPFPPRDL